MKRLISFCATTVLTFACLEGSAFAGTKVQGNLVPLVPTCMSGMCMDGSSCSSDSDCNHGTLKAGKITLGGTLHGKAGATGVVDSAGMPATGTFRLAARWWFWHGSPPRWIHHGGSWGCEAVKGKLNCKIDFSNIPELSGVPTGTGLTIDTVGLFAPPATGCTGTAEFDNPDCESGGQIGQLGVVTQ